MMKCGGVDERDAGAEGEGRARCMMVERKLQDWEKWFRSEEECRDRRKSRKSKDGYGYYYESNGNDNHHRTHNPTRKYYNNDECTIQLSRTHPCLISFFNSIQFHVRHFHHCKNHPTIRFTIVINFVQRFRMPFSHASPTQWKWICWNIERTSIPFHY